MQLDGLRALFKKASPYLKILGSGFLLYLLSSKVNLETLYGVYANMEIIWMLLAIPVFLFSKSFAAIRLYLILNTNGIAIGMAQNFKLYLLGMFYNLFLPGGVGGDGYKVYWLNKHYQSGLALNTKLMIADRLSGLFILISLVVLSTPYVPHIFELQQFSWFLLPIIMAAFFITYRSFFKLGPRIIIQTALLSIIVQLTQVLCLWVILMSLDVQGSSYIYLYLFLMATLAIIFPVTLGGLGAREVVFYYGAIWFGSSEDIALIASLLFYLVTVISGLPGVYYFFKSAEVNE